MRRNDPVLEHAALAGVSASVLAGSLALSLFLLGAGVFMVSWAGLNGLQSWRRSLNHHAFQYLLEDFDD